MCYTYIFCLCYFYSEAVLFAYDMNKMMCRYEETDLLRGYRYYHY